MTTLDRLNALMAACQAAKPIAAKDDERAPHQRELWMTAEGRALVLAAYDLFECDALFDFAADLERQAVGEAPEKELAA